jgi:cell division protein ZapE
MELRQRYLAHIRAHGYTQDPSQLRAVEALQQLANALQASQQANADRSSLAKLFVPKDKRPIKGVYLWGGVGRGKTFVMDLFFETLAVPKKRRQHFHRFMNSIHAELRKLEQQRDPLEIIADNIADEASVICFDEFFVSDIADAMLLGNLFDALFRRGVSLVATSNIPPTELYHDGLQRARFMPAIELLQEHTDALQMDSGTDYRLRVLERADLYLTPMGQTADAQLTQFFTAIAPDEAGTDVTIDILGRPIAAHRIADGVVWFDFPQICDGPRSTSDYIEVSRCYQTVLISNVPQFDASLENQARRFIALVDEFYDRRVKLMLSATAPLTDLYAGRKLQFEFQRTASRLQEMQTHEYLASRHIP